MKRSDTATEPPWRARAAEARAQLEEWHAVRALLGRFGIRGADVDDVAQEVVMVLHKRTSSDNATTPIDRRALVWGVAQRLARSHRRRFAKRQRAMEAAALLLLSPAEPTAEERAIEGETAAHVERAIAVLRTAQPSLYEVLSRHLADDAIPVIAKAIGVPEGTAHARLRRARKALGATVRRQTAEQNGRAQRARLTTGARGRWS